MKNLVSTLLITVLAMAFSFVGGAAVAQDVVLAIPFDEGQGDVAEDLSPYQNHGTLMGATEWAAGKFGQAVSMDGDDWVDAGDDDSLDLSAGDFTIALFANFGAEGHLTIASADEGPGETNKWIFIYRPTWFPAGGITFHLNWPDKGGVWISSPWIGDTDRWYQVAVTKEGFNYTFYVDGAVVDTAVDESEFPHAEAPLEIGVCEGVAHFVGLIDEFLIVKRALTQEEILNHFKGGVASVITAVQPAGKLSTTWGNIKAEAFR